MPLNHQTAVGATELSDVKCRIELRYLWLHQIRRFQIVLGVSNQSTIARMVNGPHPAIMSIKPGSCGGNVSRVPSWRSRDSPCLAPHHGKNE